MRTNFELINHSIEDLKGKWGLSIGGTFLINIAVAVGGSVVPLVGSLILLGPLYMGLAYYFLKIVRQNKELELGDFFKGFDDFGNNIGFGALYVLLYICGLILLIIPGIYFLMSSAFIWFVLNDEPELGFWEAYKKSTELMKGKYLKLFGLGLLFMLMAIASVFTLFIGYFFLLPLMYTTFANLYEDARDETGLLLEMPTREYVTKPNQETPLQLDTPDDDLSDIL